MRETTGVDGATIVRRCAWCARYFIGAAWVRVPELDTPSGRQDPPQAVSHGICPTCFDELRESDLSR